jgi:predicted dehydrogenase
MALGRSCTVGAAEQAHVDAKPAAAAVVGRAPLRDRLASGRARRCSQGDRDALQAYAQLVGICDVNPGRLELARRTSESRGAKPPSAYAPADFERMIKENDVQTVIVTTVDQFHNEYIVRAMNAGVDVVTEKPMTTTAEKCQQIFDTRRRRARTCASRSTTATRRRARR